MIIQTQRFLLRSLTPDDVTPIYLSWFQDFIIKKHIIAAQQEQTIESLKNYVDEKSKLSTCLFLGIFDQKNKHLGNIKYEPVDIQKQAAVMGILIGDPAWRGKGVASEVITASAQYLKLNLGIRWLELGADNDNEAALRSYEKCGFQVTQSPQLFSTSERYISMSWCIP